MKNTLVGIAAGLLIGASIAPAAAHHGDDLRKLKRQVSVLQKKTKYMDRDGFYLGPVVGSQVLSACSSGEAAMWIPAFETYTWIDDCLGTSRQQAARKAFR